VRVALAAIRLYRAALSPLVGPACRYVPSCSEYAEQAIVRFGIARGVLLGAWRILRCHPFSRGGLDPVPPRVSRSRNVREKAASFRLAPGRPAEDAADPGGSTV
jgi:uncharacterized protein